MVQSSFKEAENIFVKDKNHALSMFSDSLQLADECVKRIVHNQREREMYHTESRELLRKTLKKFCTSQSDKDRNKCLQEKKTTKNCFIRKKKTIKTLQ